MRVRVIRIRACARAPKRSPGQAVQDERSLRRPDNPVGSSGACALRAKKNWLTLAVQQDRVSCPSTSLMLASRKISTAAISCRRAGTIPTDTTSANAGRGGLAGSGDEVTVVLESPPRVCSSATTGTLGRVTLALALGLGRVQVRRPPEGRPTTPNSLTITPPRRRDVSRHSRARARRTGSGATPRLGPWASASYLCSRAE